MYREVHLLKGLLNKAGSHSGTTADSSLSLIVDNGLNHTSG